MSTVSHRPGAASFDYGWRYVQKKRPKGRVDYDMIPLTLEDVLHPQLGDHHVLTRSHILDCKYLQDVFAAWLAEDPTAVVLADTGIYWDIPHQGHTSASAPNGFPVYPRGHYSCRAA